MARSATGVYNTTPLKWLVAFKVLNKNTEGSLPKGKPSASNIKTYNWLFLNKNNGEGFSGSILLHSPAKSHALGVILTH